MHQTTGLHNNSNNMVPSDFMTAQLFSKYSSFRISNEMIPLALIQQLYHVCNTHTRNVHKHGISRLINDLRASEASSWK